MSPLWKTRLCSFHASGYCKSGSGCAFAHGEEDLRPLPDFQRTSVCPIMLAAGACNRTDCRYAHTCEELRLVPNLLKTRMCSFFLSGDCVVGEACRFAHDASELQQAIVVQRSAKGTGEDAQRSSASAISQLTLWNERRSAFHNGLAPCSGISESSSEVIVATPFERNTSSQSSEDSHATQLEKAMQAGQALGQENGAAVLVCRQERAQTAPGAIGSGTLVRAAAAEGQRATAALPAATGPESTTAAEAQAPLVQKTPAQMTREPDDVAEAVAMAMAVAPKAAKAVRFRSSTSPSFKPVVRLAVDLDLELEAALACSRSYDTVGLRPSSARKASASNSQSDMPTPAISSTAAVAAAPEEVPSNAPTGEPAVASSSSTYAPTAPSGSAVVGSKATSSASSAAAVVLGGGRGSKKEAPTIPRAAPGAATAVTIMDIEDFSIMAEICARVGGESDDPPRMGLLGSRSSRQPAPHGKNPGCSTCPMAPLDVPCGRRSADSDGTCAAGSTIPHHAAENASAGTEHDRQCSRQCDNTCVLCQSSGGSEPQREPCAACNCGLRIVTRNTFLTVQEEEVEVVGSSRRCRSV